MSRIVRLIDPSLRVKPVPVFLTGPGRRGRRQRLFPFLPVASSNQQRGFLSPLVHRNIGRADNVRRAGGWWGGDDTNSLDSLNASPGPSGIYTKKGAALPEQKNQGPLKKRGSEINMLNRKLTPMSGARLGGTIR